MHVGCSDWLGCLFVMASSVLVTAALMARSVRAMKWVMLAASLLSLAAALWSISSLVRTVLLNRPEPSHTTQPQLPPKPL